MLKNISLTVLMCAILVLYALLRSVLVYFSFSLENLEFVKSEMKCLEISQCLQRSKITTYIKDNLKDFQHYINDINDSRKYYKMNILFVCS